ncbi:MAG: hypothetical protein RPU35_09285 [Candidatus Sedimenticola sp. (ex Thyasira tokunagai)]
MPTLLPLWRAARTTGKQCGLTATGDYQPSLRSPWLAALVGHEGLFGFTSPFGPWSQAPTFSFALLSCRTFGQWIKSFGLFA